MEFYMGGLQFELKWCSMDIDIDGSSSLKLPHAIKYLFDPRLVMIMNEYLARDSRETQVLGIASTCILFLAIAGVITQLLAAVARVTLQALSLKSNRIEFYSSWVVRLQPKIDLLFLSS